MTSNDSSNQLTQKVCQAAVRGDSVLVGRLLGSNRRIASRIDTGLLSPSSACQNVLQSMASSDAVPRCNSEHALRALLMVSPSYETPWRAIVQLVESLHSQSGWLGSSPNVLFAGIADAQTFLQQTISSWWKLENSVGDTEMKVARQESTPREWLLRIAQAAMKPLHDDTAVVTASDNRHWVLPLDLVTTIISFCQELEGPSSVTKHAILDHLLSDTLLKARILPILSLAHDLRSQLREVDWKRLHTLMKDSLSSNMIQPSDLPGVAQRIITFSDQNQEWKQHLLRVLQVSSHDLSTHSTVEAVIQSSLSAQSTQMLYDWHSVKPTESIQKWILANYYLLLFSAARQSGSQIVSRLLSRALGKDDNAFNMLDLCGQSLVSICFPSIMKARQKFNIVPLRRLLDGVSYDGEGKFSRKKQPIKELELAVLSQSLYLGSTKLENRKQRLSAAERAQAWIHAATFLLSKPNFADKLSAVLIIVAVFCEVPASRSTLIRNMVGDGKVLKNEDCLIIGLLVKSLKSQTDLEALEPICTYYSNKSLSFEVFAELADAFAFIASGRGAIFSVCQKKLHASNAPWWDGIDLRGSSERKEMLQSSLYGLCVLLVEWDDVGWSAWKLLSDFLVLNKPSLPVIVRSWLYRRLLAFVRKDRFSTSTTEHLLRALLTRLLSYFDWAEGIITFVPQRAVASFASSGVTMVKEDVPLLFHLVTELTLKVARANGVSNIDLEKCRLEVQGVGSNPKRDMFEVGTEPHYHTLLAALLASALQCVMSKANVADNLVLRASISSCRTKMSKSIVNDEKDAYSRGIFSANDRLPEWVSSRIDSKACGDHVEPPRHLYLSLCDLLVGFLSFEFLSLRSETKAALVVSLSNIYSARRKIDSSENLIKALDLPVATHCVAPVMVRMFSESVHGMLEEGRQTTLEDFAVVLTGLENVCDAVTAQAVSLIDGDEEGSEDLLALLGETYRLHHQVTSEGPTIRLFQFLEVACSGRSSTSQDAEGIMTIRDAKGANNVVCEFRAKILRALLACVNAISVSCRAETTYPDGIFGKRDPNRDIDGKAVASFASGVLKAMTEDLLYGMREHSGVVIDMVYGLYLEIAESLSSLILRLLPLSGEVNPVADAIDAALARTEEILSEIPIQEDSLFKRTMNVAVVVLPSLHRAVLQHSTVGARIESRKSRASFAGALAKQLLELVKRESRGESIVFETPAETPGIFHTKDDVPVDTRTDSIPLEISIPARQAGRSTAQRCKDVIISSDAGFRYALYSVMSAIDAELNEVVVQLQQKGAMSQISSCSDLDSWCFPRRREGLHRCMEVVCCYFRCLANDSEGTNDPTRVLAQDLSNPSKLKLAVCLDKLLLVLARSLRLLLMYCQTGRYSPETLSEAVSAVVTWITDDRLDLIAGPRRWHSAEQLSAKAQKAGKNCVDRVLGRFPKTMSRVDEVETLLQRLVDAEISWTTKASIQASRYRAVEEVIEESIVNASALRNISLKKGMKCQLASAKASRPRGLNHFAEIAGRKKRKVQQNNLAKRMRRERRQPVPRSRNHVVDHWLQADQEQKDEGSDEDAFADLEDFLVEG